MQIQFSFSSWGKSFKCFAAFFGWRFWRETDRERGGKQYVFGFKISQILWAVSWMVLFWAVASLWVIFWVKLFHFYPDSLILNVLFLRKWPRKQNLNDLLKVRAYEGGDTFWNFSAVDEPNQHRMLTENLFWCIFFAKKISLQWTQPNRGRDEQNRRKN